MPENPRKSPALPQPPSFELQLKARFQSFCLLQQPTIARFAPQQPRKHGEQQYAQDKQYQQATQQGPEQKPTHSSAPMEKCMRKPSSGSLIDWARSRRMGPTGDTQRMPTPALVFIGSVQLSMALPWSTKVAARHLGMNSYWYSRLPASMKRPPTLSPVSSVGDSVR